MDLGGVDFRGFDLKGMDLRGVAFECGDVEGKDLIGNHNTDMGLGCVGTEADGGSRWADILEEAAVFAGRVGFDLDESLRHRSDECCEKCDSERRRAKSIRLRCLILSPTFTPFHPAIPPTSHTHLLPPGLLP